MGFGDMLDSLENTMQGAVNDAENISHDVVNEVPVLTAKVSQGMGTVMTGIEAKASTVATFGSKTLSGINGIAQNEVLPALEHVGQEEEEMAEGGDVEGEDEDPP